MVNLINEVLGMYEDACAYEAIATWDEDDSMQEKANVAWNRYEGAKKLLALVFNVTEEAVDEDMETLMVEKTL